MIRVYKDFYVEDMFDLLERASNNGHLQSVCVDSEVASLLYDFMEMSSNDEISEDEIYDFIRFEMEIQTEEEIKENYEEARESDDMEDFLSYHTSYIGNYEEDGQTIHIFSSF